MMVGDADQAAIVTALLTAALLRHRPQATAADAAEEFQRVADALRSLGIIAPVVARQQVMRSGVAE